MRRLTRLEYDNTVRDLLGVDTKPASAAFPPEEMAQHFDNNGAALAFPQTLADRALTAANTLAKSLAASPTRFAACAGSAKDETCARSVLSSFAQRAYRRPPEAPEVEALMSVFRRGAKASFEHGLELAATTVLISLPFFYRVERGDGVEVDGKPGFVRPTSWEMASRLSYFFLASMPDDALLQAAAADTLRDATAVDAQARRLFTKARPSLSHFHEQWLRLGGIAGAAKDPKLFANYNSQAPLALRQEVNLFLESVASGTGGLRELLTGNYGFVNQDSAPLYGLATPALASGFQRVELDPAQRSGILTLAGPLAMLAGFEKTSPIRRGVFVRENLLCQTLPPPPANAAASIPDVQAGLTRRQAVEAHSKDPVCSGCHRLIDSIGVSFEGYDAAGRFRTEEEGKPIDTSGSVADSSIPPFGGGVELGRLIAASPEGQSCLAKQIFRYALGRTEQGNDADIARLTKVVGSADGSYENVLVGVTQTDGFLLLPKPEVLP